MADRRQPIVAIDGPAGAGKSTVAKLVAQKLGFRYIDTGAMYRTVTLKAMQQKIDLTDGQAVESVAEKIDMAFVPGAANQVLLEEQDVSQAIRAPEVTRQVSAYVANYPGVRRAMVNLQQEMGRQGGVVMEGRDITTVVFPDAEIKVYLDASQEERARRRYLELQGKEPKQDYQELLHDLIKRDKEDLERPGGALKKVDEAQPIDTTGLSIDQVVEKIVALVKKKS